MPTYQYACTNAACGNRFDLVQTFTDPAASVCPVCGEAVRKVFSPVGVVFKGSGFYRNDSRSEAGKAKATAAAKSDSGAKSESGGKSESSGSDSSGKSESGAKSDSGSKPDAKSADSGGSATNGSTKTGAPAGSTSGSKASTPA